METDRGPADAYGAEQGLADPRLWDVLSGRVLPRLAAASLAHLRATCSSMHRLLDDSLSHAAWQSAFEQLQNGRRAHEPPQQHLHLSLPSSHQQNGEDLPLQEQDQQQDDGETAPSRASFEAFNQVMQLPDEDSWSRAAQPPWESSAAFNRDMLQPDERLQPSLAENRPCEVASDTSQPSAVGVQQKLQQLGSLLRNMRGGGEVLLKPLDANAIKGAYAKWSSCGRWVALEQVANPNHLIVWDTRTNTSQKVGIMPRDSFSTFSWLPASAWLVYVKTSLFTRPSKDFSKQSIFCQDMASGERWELRLEVRLELRLELRLEVAAAIGGPPLPLPPRARSWHTSTAFVLCCCGCPASSRLGRFCHKRVPGTPTTLWQQ